MPTTTRAEIVAAAVTVFAEKGYAATTLEGIARLVGLTRQGVLHHFPSKEALFAEVIADQARWAREQDVGGSAGSPLHGLRALVPFLGRADAVRDRLQLVQVLQGEAMSGSGAARDFAMTRLAGVREQIAARIETARTEGEVLVDADPQTLATLIGAAVNGLQAQWLLDDSVDTAAAFDLLLRLVTTAPPEG